MAREFKLPDIGEGLTEADIVRWLVAEGDTVEADQAIVEVETDKAVVEIPSPYGGVVLRHGCPEGETIEVGEVLVVIGEAGEAPPPSDPAAVDDAGPEPIVGTLHEEAEFLDTHRLAEPAPRTAAVAKALPVVRKLARDLGVDLAAVTGTGPDGRISREDVEAAAAVEPEVTLSSVWDDETPPAASPAPAGDLARPEARSDAAAPKDESRRVPMSRLRRTIAANMSLSWSQVPHVTTFDDLDATRLLEVRQALVSRHHPKIPIEALVAKAVIPALAEFPEFNATVDDDHLVIHGAYHIGIAVDTPDGLVVAVIDDAASRGVLDLAGEVRRLGEGAKARTLSPEELTGQTFTITNIGAVGGGHGTPIVPPGTTAILSIGRARAKPAVHNGELVVAPLMPLSLSYDHRVIDGAMGRRFMALVMENLSEPALFLAG